MKKQIAVSLLAGCCSSRRLPSTVEAAAAVVAVEAIHTEHCLCPRMPSNPRPRDRPFDVLVQSERSCCHREIYARGSRQIGVCFGSIIFGRVSAVRLCAVTQAE